MADNSDDRPAGDRRQPNKRKREDGGQQAQEEEPLGKRRRTATKVEATPTLAIPLAGGGTEGPCGSFMRKRNVTVKNAARATKGFVIQKVTRVFTVEIFDPGTQTWTPTDGAQLDTYVNGGNVDFISQCYATCGTYWELWEVKPDGRVPHREDCFALCSIIPPGDRKANTSRGSFVITGEAWLYLTDDVDPFDEDGLAFVPENDDVPASGGLPSTLTDPADMLESLDLQPHGDCVWFQVKVAWDSEGADLGSKVEMRFAPD